MDAPTRRRPAPLLVLLFGAAIGLLGGMVWALAAPGGYVATSAVFVSTQGADAVSDLQEQNGFDQQAGDSFASLGTSPIVLEPVARVLDVSEAELARRVSVGRQTDTALLSVSVADPSASRAALAANAVARRLIEVGPTLVPAASVAVDVHLTQVETAVAGEAVRDSGLRTVLAGLLIGTGVVAVALLSTRLRRRRPPAGGGLAAPSLL